MRKIIGGLGLLLVLLAGDLNATHLLGGEITWECVGSGQYRFQLTLYRECGSVPFPPATLPASTSINGPSGQITVTRQSITEVSPTCLNTSISCANSASGQGAVERHYYVSGNVSLSGTPPPTGWTFSWTSCCRPGSVVNINNAGSTGYFLRARMYPYTPVGAATPNNANPCYDSSPYFSETGALTICTGSDFTYNHLVADRDADSLYIRWAQPLDNSLSSPVSWASGYNQTSPYPNPNIHASNGPVTLNGFTGEINMNIQTDPSGGGSYASCFAIEAWKCGQTPSGPAPVKVAEVFRDVAIVTQTGCPGNNEPTVLLDTSLYPNIDQLGPKLFEANVYPGDTIEFELSASDFDYNTLPTGGLIPQEIVFQAEGLQASSPYASGTGCNGVAPCAQFFPVSPQTQYNQALNNRIRYFWVPDCQHLNVSGNFCNPFATFYFSLRMQDDGCPAPRIALTTFIVNVQIGDPSPVILSCISDEGNDDLRLGWHRSAQDSALEFNYYIILGSNSPGGPYDTIQRIDDIDSLSYTFNNANNYQYFYMVKSTGKCDFFSQPSDTIKPISMTLTATPPGNAETANLSWTAPRSPLPWTTAGEYEIWTEAPAGSGNWVQVGSTTNLTFTDQVTVCNAVANYQIRVYDTVTGCYSASNLDSALFSDQSNRDVLYIDSVTVAPSQLSSMAWSPTTSGDVVEYQVYFNDPAIGWTVVDVVPVGATLPWEWVNSQADSRAEEFRIVSVDSCGNQSDDQIVKPHKTIFLRGYINKCEGFARLSWSNYQGFGKDGIQFYRLEVQTTDASGNVSGWNTLFIGNEEDTAFTQYNLRNNTEYCYRVRVRDTSGLRSSTSNVICRLAEVPQKSRILYLAQVTNDYNREALKLNFLIDGEADVESFDIERAPTYQGPYQAIGTVGKPAIPPYLIEFIDYGADPERFSYFYRVSATDSCGGRDTLSNLGRNIILNVEERSNLTNYLHWSPYQQWDGIVARYNIYRKAGEEIDYTRVAQVQGNDTTYLDDVSDYRDSRGNFCYYVEAVEGNNSLGLVDGAGNPYTSLSNQECLNQSAKVFVPSGFRPGSSIPANQTFGPSLRFNDVENYEFYIMNRWGVKVFETNDPEVRWDGTENGEDAESGVYVYYLKYATPGSRAQEQRGTFTLIR